MHTLLPREGNRVGKHVPLSSGCFALRKSNKLNEKSGLKG
jgi:hypothetical protein